MSAHDQSLRASDTQNNFEVGTDEPSGSSSAAKAYYMALEERLETLIVDMQQHGTASNDPLFLRLVDLLSETRALVRKSK